METPTASAAKAADAESIPAPKLAAIGFGSRGAVPRARVTGKRASVAPDATERNPNAQPIGVLETSLQCLLQALPRPGQFAQGQLVMTRGAAFSIATRNKLSQGFA